MTCKAAYGAGCTQCNDTHCVTCTDDECCSDNTKIVVDSNGDIVCGTCADAFGDSCSKCSTLQCTLCSDDMIVNPDDQKCASCSTVFDNCGKCTEDKCTECEKKDGWILTYNGCYKNTDSSSEDSSSDNDIASGVIAGIVISCFILLAAIGIFVWCLVKSNLKHASTPEEKTQFISMSVL